MSDCVLTVVTATFNAVKAGRAEMLERCVKSVAALKTPHEHLIYDGGSRDGSVDLLHELEQKYPNVKVVSEPDKGVYDALNKGVRDAKGEWFYVLGDDDFIQSNENFSLAIKTGNETNSDFIISPVVTSDGNLILKSKKQLRCVLTLTPYSHQGVIMKTSWVRKMNGFRVKYKITADFDLMLRSHLDGVKYTFSLCPYACFAVGGFSGQAELSYADEMNVASDVFNLNSLEIQTLRRTRILPLRVIVPLLVHSDAIIRLGARHALKRKIAMLIGMVDSHGIPRGFFKRI